MSTEAIASEIQQKPTVTSQNSSQSAEIGKLAEALAKAQGEMSGARADSENPYFKSTYADLSSVWEACRGPLSKNGLAVIQTTAAADQGVKVVTTLAHSSGQWIRGELTMRPVKNDPQGIGSALTYARRYSLSGMVGIAPVEDDDGEGAMGRDTKPKKRANQPAQKSAPKQDPSTGNGNGEYVVPFGKFKGQALSQVSTEDLQGYLKYIEGKAGENPNPQVVQFIDEAKKSLSNGRWAQ